MGDEKGGTDKEDSIALMRITGYNTKARLMALLARFYPRIIEMGSPALKARLDVKMEDLLDALRDRPGDVQPTWNAGRGHG